MARTQHVRNEEEKGDNEYPKITDFYSIPLCLKQRLQNKRKIDLSADFNLINPNIHMLFNKYNALFFDHKLNDVVLDWNHREKLSAGFCERFPLQPEIEHDEKESTAECLISISLSVNLLQFRPTKDLVETLIHEMIHAYLYAKQLHDKEKTPHGKRFLSIMNVINYVCNECQLNVVRAHEFHSELNANLSHKWQCNGGCEKFVYRPSCRPPGKHERWWTQHQLQCGGVFEVAEFHDRYKRNKQDWEHQKTRKKAEKQKQKKMKKEQREKKWRANNEDHGYDAEAERPAVGKFKKVYSSKKRRNKYKVTMF